MKKTRIWLAIIIVYLVVGSVNCQQAPLQNKMLDIEWHLAPDPPSTLQDPEVCVIDDTLISVCGFNNAGGSTGFLRKTYALGLNDRARGWSTLPDFPGTPRQGLFGGVVDSKLYVWGGFSYTEPVTKIDGYRLWKPGASWVWDALPDLPWPMCYSGVAVIGSKIYVQGGLFYIYSDGFYSEIEHGGPNLDLGAHLLMIDTNELASGWQLLSDCPGSTRGIHAMAAIDGQLYVLGGMSCPGPTSSSRGEVIDNWKYDPGTDTWTRLADTSSTTGDAPDNKIVFNNRYILLFGGAILGQAYNNRVVVSSYGTHLETGQLGSYSTLGVYADVLVYDTATDQFGRGDTMPVYNAVPSAVMHNNEVFLIGGETGDVWLKDFPDGARYDPNGAFYPNRPNLCLTGIVKEVAK